MSEETEDRLGMTDEQWERFQAYTHGYGEQDENGVDISLLRANLRLTPTERIEKMQRSLKIQEEVRMPEYEPDFRGVIAALNAAGARFVLIGGLAMIAHGSDYVTQDIDFGYARDRENLKAIADALADAHPRLRGFPPGLPFHWDEKTLRAGSNFTLETDAAQVDLLGDISRVESFEGLWERSVVIEVFGEQIHVASLDDLIAMKRAANRAKDQLHLGELERMRRQGK